MSDEADIANEYLQQMIDTALNNAHQKATIQHNATGKCIWCEELVQDKRRWCSVDCRNEYEKHNK
jgi:hypothetical protein